MIHHLFEQTAEKYKTKIAISYKTESITYEQLNIRANQLAYELIKNGVTYGANVVILMDRSFDMIVSIMAVLKAGGAYVPVDPDYPSAVIEYIVENSNAKIVLINVKEKLGEKLNSDHKIIDVSVINNRTKEIKNPAIGLPDDALAYGVEQ